jgi:hypothetical protein
MKELEKKEGAIGKVLHEIEKKLCEKMVKREKNEHILRCQGKVRQQTSSKGEMKGRNSLGRNERGGKGC